jgi:hypothetical protein
MSNTITNTPQSTAQAAFGQKQRDTNHVKLQDMRSANFAIGKMKVDYTTTNQTVAETLSKHASEQVSTEQRLNE